MRTLSSVSKAFTREDADAGFDMPAPSARMSEARLTAYGARLARERLQELEHARAPSEPSLEGDRLRELLGVAEILAPAGGQVVALGARTRVRSESGTERVLAIVTPEEVGLVPLAISAASPLARALLGARVGETVEVELPRGTEELTVLAIDWPT